MKNRVLALKKLVFQCMCRELVGKMGVHMVNKHANKQESVRWLYGYLTREKNKITEKGVESTKEDLKGKYI